MTISRICSTAPRKGRNITKVCMCDDYPDVIIPMNFHVVFGSVVSISGCLKSEFTSNKASPYRQSSLPRWQWYSVTKLLYVHKVKKQYILQMFSTAARFVRAHWTFAHHGGKHSDYCCFEGVTYVPVTLCHKLSFLTWVLSVQTFRWPVSRPIGYDEQIEIQIFNYNKYLSNRSLWFTVIQLTFSSLLTLVYLVEK